MIRCKPLPQLAVGRPCQLSSCPLCWPCLGTSGRAASCLITSRSSPRHQLPKDKQTLSWQCLWNIQNLQWWSQCRSITDSQWQSTTIQKRVYISKPLRCNKKGISHKKRKWSLDYKFEWDTLGLPNRAHHFQVYTAAVASADNIAINKTFLVIRPTKRLHKQPRIQKTEPRRVCITVNGCYHMHMDSISMCSNTWYMSNMDAGTNLRRVSASIMT